LRISKRFTGPPLSSDPSDIPLTNLSKILNLKPGGMAAVMGAGGKATLTKRLVIEYVEEGTPVLVTRTTNLRSLENWTDPALLLSEADREKASDAARKWAARGAIVWVENKLPENIFLRIPVKQVEPLHTMGAESVLIVKTDGARKRLIKAPAKKEPVIPCGVTHCLLVLGLNAIGQRASPDIVFRFETSCQIAGFEEGQSIEACHLATLAGHPESYPARLPAKASRILYLSHANSPDRLRLAREVCSAVPEGIFNICVAGDSIKGLFHIIREEK